MMTFPPTLKTCHHRDDCRLCESQRLVEALSLTPTPPANAFVTSSEVGQLQKTYPLDLFFCENCGHLQLSDIVDPEILFENYVYVSGTSESFIQHFRKYAEALLGRRDQRSSDLAVDIGSNDGTLLRFFRQGGMRVIGVDPARDIAAEANASGIETVNAFFGSSLAGHLRKSHGTAGIVTANNVFAHINDLADVTAGVRYLLDDNGLFSFEVSYLADVYRDLLFDTIYHEHLSYHSVGPLVGFLNRHGMRLIAVERVNTHGGSIRCLACKAGADHAVDDSVQKALAEERDLKIDRAETWKDFGSRISALGAEVRTLLGNLRGNGKTIAAYGAPAKATTLMHHFGLVRDMVSFVVDDNPRKQGLFTPGRHIPVVARDVLEAQPPDYLLVLAWNFAETIIAKNEHLHKAGMRFIVPLPKLQVV